MKTSKKILSLFLAVVMVITTCSVGFTAFAADGNKTDSNNAYWNDNTDTEEAFNAVTALVNNYVPVLANGALKSVLEGLGMTVTENTSLQDIVAGVSPALMKALGSKGNKEQIITGYYKELGYSNSDAESMYKKYSAFGLYDYLDDADASMDFYAIYQFCVDNQNSSDDERKEFAQKNLPKLKKLLHAHLDAYDSLFSENGGEEVAGTAALKAYKKQVEDGGIVFDEKLTLYDLENFEIGGIKLKDVHKTDKSCNTKIAYDNMYLDFEGAPFQIDNIAAALFYQYNENYAMAMFYLYLANLGGAEVKYNGTAITPSNYKDVIGKSKSYAEFCTENGFEQNAKSASAYDSYCLNEVYNTIFDGSTQSSKIDSSNEFASPYYSAIAAGALEATKSYDTAAYANVKDFIKAQTITDDQIKALYNYVALEGGDITSYLENDNCAFSSYARNFLKDFLSGSDYVRSSIDINLQNCADENAAVDVFRRFAISYEFDDFIPADGDDIMLYYIDEDYPSDDATPFVKITENMLPSAIIQQMTGKEAAFGFYGTANVKYFYEDNNIGKLVKGLLGNDKYEYDEYAIPDSMAIDVVNATINGYLEYLKPGTDIGNVVSQLLGDLITSDLDLYNSLNDIWKNLYEKPIETVFNLLPVLVILVDEVVVPMVFNDNGPESSALYGILAKGLFEGGGIPAIKALLQESGNTSVGIGNLAFDLNKVLPSILNWLVGNEDKAKEIVGTYSAFAEGVDTSVPIFTNIYVADKAIAGAHLNGGLAKVLKENDSFKGDNAALADAIDEAVTELASFALDSVNDYLAAHKDDVRYNANGEVAQKGLNNLFVALPELLDIMGKKFINKYDVNSDWSLEYRVQTVMNAKIGKEQKQNVILDGFKALATENDSTKVLEYFVNTLIGEWMNPIIDIVNDTIQDPNNKITSNLALVQGLLDAIGGFGEKSILTDVFNGLFQLKRSDAASFSLKKRDNGFVGFSTESGMFLLSNILYKDDSGNVKGLIPFITTLIKGDGKADYDINGSLKSTSPLLASSSKAKKSAAGTKYSELLSSENKKAATKLVDALDNLLASLLENTSLNGFDLDKTDNILSAVATVASSYFGAKNTNDIVKLINNYFYYIVGETKDHPGEYGKIGILPKDGDVDAEKVYTSANLSNLVIQTYSLVENIVDYLFYNPNSGFLRTRDPNMLLADAAYGLISPDAVAVRLSEKYSTTAAILLDKDSMNWNSFKVEITAANETTGSYTKDYLKFGFSKGDKAAFYDALGESLNGIAGLIGAVLTASYTDASKSGNYYSNLVYPLFSSINKALGTSGVMTPAEFNKASASDKLIKGIITPVSAALDTLYKAPASFLLNFVKGVAALLDDSSVKMLIAGAIAPISNLITGAAKVVNNLSPTLANVIVSKVSINVSLPEKDVVVSLINNLQSFIKLPSINWTKLASASSPAEVLLLVYGYIVDTILGSELITNLINSLAPGLTDILSNLSATQILNVINEILKVVQSPTEVYWTFSEYATKLTGTFTYPTGILASEADKAVDQLDDLVANVFPLLNSLGVTDIEGLSSIINDNLYTNEILTTIAKALYGALSKGTVATVLGAIDTDVSPKGYAEYLTDKSYGKTFSSAAATLKKAKSWDDVKSLNWGFTNGSSKAQAGFVNGLAALLRPLNNVLSVLLAEGKLDSSKLDIEGLIKSLSLKGSTPYAEGSEYGGTIEYKLKDGTFILTLRSNAIVDSGKPAARNVLKIDVNSIVDGFNDLLSDPNFGTNGYESAVIPLLEAFMCKDVKTYKQYKADYKKAKDNLIIDVLNPVFGLVSDIAENPFNTVTKILPNVAYFIDNNGVSQLVGNLLAPITADDGILGVLKKNGVDVDKLIKELTGKSLGKIITDALGLKKVKLTLKLNKLEASNLQDLVVPVVQKLLKDKLGLTLPTFDFETIASHGTLNTVSSKAKNDKGKFTTKQVKADKGEVLVAVLRYVSDVLIKNAAPLKKLITGIDAIKKNDTIKNIVASVFNQMATAGKDDIVRAVFYFLTERATDNFFDYRDFKYKDDYTFSFGNMDEDFCRKLAPMLDGLVGGLLEGGLGGLVEEKLYTDDLVAKLATGLYGAIEGVKISDSIGSLTNLLAQTDIDFSTSNVAKLLTNSDYGLTYPAAASTIRNAGSWSKVNAESLKFGVKDRASFLNALVAVLRPIYGVLDVLLNDGSLNLFNLVKVPGSDGYSSTIVPLLEAFGVYNIKTQYQYREDTYEAYDNILLDIINPLWDKVEDILNAPVEMLADILPNLSLFFANDGLLQIVDNLFTPISALLQALKPIVDVNAILKAAGLDVAKLLKDKVGLNVPKFDLYDLPGTLKPLVGADNVVGTLNSVLGIIKIKGTPLGIVLPEIDWFKLASHGEFVPNATSQAATYGGRIAVIADQDETLIAVLRFLIETINYKGNYDAIVDLIGGILGDNASAAVSDVISQVLGMLKGDPDEVIEQLVELLQQFA